MAKEFIPNYDDVLEKLLVAGQKFFLEATDEEILAEAKAAGEDINESAEQFRHMVAAARGRLDDESPSCHLRKFVKRLGLDGISRAIDAHPGSFKLVFAGAGSVLGTATQTYEWDLMQILQDLEVASEFEEFKLVCEIGRGTRLSAILLPRTSLVGAALPIDISLYLSPTPPTSREGRRRHMKAPQRLLEIHLRPHLGETARASVAFAEMGNPSTFSGKLEIRIREGQQRTEEADDQ